MRHRVAGTKFSVDVDHRRSLLKNLLRSYIMHEYLVSTEAKIKALKGLFDKVVSRAKKGDLHSRRLVSRFITDRSAFIKLFTVLVPKFSTRSSGYSRTVLLEHPRVGDGSKLMRIEMVFDAVSGGKSEGDQVGGQLSVNTPSPKGVAKKTG